MKSNTPWPWGRGWGGAWGEEGGELDKLQNMSSVLLELCMGWHP